MISWLVDWPSGWLLLWLFGCFPSRLPSNDINLARDGLTDWFVNDPRLKYAIWRYIDSLHFQSGYEPRDGETRGLAKKGKRRERRERERRRTKKRERVKLETRERGRKIDWQYSETVGPRRSIWRGKGTDELYSQLTPSPAMEFLEFYRSSQFFFLSLHWNS